MRLQFAGRKDPGVGVALELQLVDQETQEPAPMAPLVLEKLQGQPGIRESLFQSIIQLETNIVPRVDQVREELKNLYGMLQPVCKSLGVDLLASGTHPTASWRDLHTTENSRYERFIRRLQWVGRRAAVYGLRIHVGVPDGEKAVAVGTSLASLVPMLVAMSASSPFWHGVDTGLASCRTRIIENIPNAGLPPNLLNFAEFQSYVKTLRAAETIETINDIWWDVRPHLRKGTLEIQACDMPHTFAEVLAMAAFSQTVVVWLLRNYEAGELTPTAEGWLIRENKWRATRFGIGAELIDGLGGDTVKIPDFYERIREHGRKAIEELELAPYFEVLERILDSGPGYLRQLRACKRGGLDQVPRLLVEELREDQFLA